MYSYKDIHFVVFKFLWVFLFQDYVNMLMPPLIEKWNVLKDEDKDLFPLLEVWIKKRTFGGRTYSLQEIIMK